MMCDLSDVIIKEYYKRSESTTSTFQIMVRVIADN